MLLTLCWLLVPPQAWACTSDAPTFEYVLTNARAIARVTIIDIPEPGPGPPYVETYRVERRLKGTLPDVVELAKAYTNLCHDRIAYYAGPEGRTAIIAFDVPFFNDTIHPIWYEGPDGLQSTVWGTEDLTSLAELERAILRSLPETSTEPQAGDASLPVILAVVFGLAIVLLLRRRHA
jgi:hypothetical protein